MSREQIDQFIEPTHSSSQQDIAGSSLNNLNKELKDFEHRFKGYHIQKPFSDSDSEEEKKPVFNPVVEPIRKKEIKQQTNRMAQIKDQIKWKDSQIEQLLKLEGDAPKDKKIRELAQKVKLLSINLQKQKNTKRKMQNEFSAIKPSNISSLNDMKKSIKPSNEDDLKNKLSQSQKQVMQMRLKNQNLKNQLNKAMRVISREVGDQTNIDDILSQENAWKGRQQKIEHLKGRVKELESKLSNNSVDVSHMSGFTMLSSDKTSKQQNTINNLTENRRKEMQNLKVQVQAVKSQNQILQGKVKALASRKGTLETQVKDLKAEYQKKQKLFKEKSQNDDKYIALLKAENQKLKKQKEEKVVTKLVYKNSSDATEGTDKKQVQKLKVLLTKKQTEIKQLQQKVDSSKYKQPTKQQPKSRQLRPKSTDKTQKVIQKKIQQLQKQYINQQNADKSLTPEEEEAVYKQWKQNKLKGSK